MFGNKIPLTIMLLLKWLKTFYICLTVEDFVLCEPRIYQVIANS